MGALGAPRWEVRGLWELVVSWGSGGVWLRTGVAEAHDSCCRRLVTRTEVVEVVPRWAVAGVSATALAGVAMGGARREAGG